jgi:hypothetical protein
MSPDELVSLINLVEMNKQSRLRPQNDTVVRSEIDRYCHRAIGSLRLIYDGVS